MEDSVRVLIAEDHPLFREGMRGRLDRVADITVVGEAASGEEAVELARNLEPDVILMDIKMPGLNGIEATREILRSSPRGVGVLVLTMFEDDDSVFAAMRAGARGYLLKDSGGEGVVHAIRAVASGEAVFGAGVAERIMGFFSAPRSSALPKRTFPELSEREEEVLSLVAKGKSNQQIARELFVSLKTVRNHVSNILLKLQVADRAQAVIRARDAGMGRDGV